jgi:hypothetical protein
MTLLKEIILLKLMSKLIKVTGDTFPCCVKDFFFAGPKPEYFGIKAGGNMLLYTRSFTEEYPDLYKINFFEENVNLPLHLAKNMSFEFISNVPCTLFVTESNEKFEENCEINLPNGKIMVLRNGLIGLQKNDIVAELTFDEFISYKLKKLYTENFVDTTNCLDILHYLIYREDDSYKYLTNDLRKDHDLTVIMKILENLYENKYKQVFETLPDIIKNNLVNLGFSVEKGKYILYGLN